jgi:Gas vesicle synthesis protein GvpO
MAERRRVRGGTGSRTSARSREPADRDEREMLESEPAAADEDGLVDADEPEEIDDETLDADEPEPADEDEPPGNGQRRPARRSRSAMTAGEAAKAALREIAQLTAKEPEGVTGVERTEDGWTVGIELVEDQRIPSSADILATYEATIDADGELVSYRRVRRYARGRADAEEL